MPPAIARLVVIKPGALGDTLLLAPALRALRESLPSLEITVVGCMPAVGLLKRLDVADAVIAIDRLNLYAPARTERQFLRGARVVAFIPLDSDVRRGLRRIAGAAAVASFPSRTGRPGQHTAQYLHQCLHAVFPAMHAISRAPFDCRRVNRQISEKPYAVLAPGAGSEAKRAPMAVFMAAARSVSRQSLQPVFIAGEVEVARGLVRQYPREYRQCLNIKLTALASLFKGACAVFANDSGPAHLAGLLGAHTIVFFGPTDPDIWRPWGPKVFVRRFQTNGID